MISVIIPIYNVSQYLSQCLDSVLAQSYKDLEIILVDDGSTDGCAVICDEYKGKDRRIQVIHKKNGGLSDARNAGMKIAKGEWIYFVDSDDWLAEEAIERLYEYAIVHNCDMVQGNMYYVYKDHMLYRQANGKERKRTILTCDEAMRELIINDRVKNFAWGKLYKRGLIQDLDFPVGKYFEDSFWQHHIIDIVERYGIIDEPLYYYRQRGDSISGTSSTRFNDLLEGNRERLNFIRERYPELFPLMEKKYKKIYNQMNPPDDMGYKCVLFVRKVVGRIRPSLYKRINL